MSIHYGKRLTGNIAYNYQRILDKKYSGIINIPVTPFNVYSDVTATTIATYGQPVAAIRDHKNAIVATQSTISSRPIFGRHPEAGIRNILLSNTSDITEGEGWNFSFRITRQDTVDTVIGEPATIVTASETNVNGGALVSSPITLDAGTYTLSAYVSGTGWIKIRSSVNSDFTDAAFAWFNLGTGELGNSGRGTGLVYTNNTSSITPVGNGYRISITFTTGETASISNRFYIVDGNGSLSVTQGASFKIEAPQLEVGSISNYQKRISAFDITEKFNRSAYYLYVDGVDDFMSLQNSFAPIAGYTIVAAHDMYPEPENITFDSTKGIIFGNEITTQIKFYRGSRTRINLDRVSATERISAQTDSIPGKVVDFVSIISGTERTFSRNGKLVTNYPALDGTVIGIEFDTLFRSASLYGVGRFYGGLLIPSSVNEDERLILQTQYGLKCGIDL